MSHWEPGELNRTIELQQPFGDVPPHLYLPLISWVQESIPTAESLYMALIRMQVDDCPDPRTKPHGLYSCFEYLKDGLTSSGLLNLTELILKVAPQGKADKLQTILTLGNSLYDVRPDGRGLQKRVTEEAKGAVEEAIKAAHNADNNAAEHLNAAWNDVYGLHNDPHSAYDHAVKAVEAAATPVLLPNDSKVTLGKLIGEMRGISSNLETAIDRQGTPGPPAILAMMGTVWTNNARHAGDDTGPPETQEAAEMAIHLATALVQLFISGAVRRK